MAKNQNGVSAYLLTSKQHMILVQTEALSLLVEKFDNKKSFKTAT